MLSRRILLMSGAGLALGGCAGISANTSAITQQAVTALQAVAAEITQVIPQLTAAGLGGNTLNSVQLIVNEVQQVLGGIGTATTQGQGQSALVQVEAYINQLAPLILPFLSAIPGGSIIGMIVAALPAIEAAIGVAVTELSGLAQSIASSAPAVPASARFGAAASTSQAYLNMLEQAARNSGRLNRRHR